MDVARGSTKWVLLIGWTSSPGQVGRFAMFRGSTEAGASGDLVVMQSLDVKAWLRRTRCNLSAGAGAFWVICNLDVNAKAASLDVGKASK